jgi:aconitase B
MSNQIKGFTVTLRRDISEERAAKLKNALLFFEDVLDVCEEITDGRDYMARQVVRAEIVGKLFDALK